MSYKTMQVRGSSVLMWRLGPLGYYKQNMWDRAPESKGMWAFPWPYFDEGYVVHQYHRLMPKRLQTFPNSFYPLDPQYYEHEDGSPVRREDIAFGRMRDEDSEWEELVPGLRLREDRDFYEDREEWVEKVGRKRLPRKKFYWEGEVYTHLHPNHSYRDFHQVGTTSFDWFRMDVREYVKLVQRSRGVEESWARDDAMYGQRLGIRYAAGHLEVFLSPKHGRFHGVAGEG